MRRIIILTISMFLFGSLTAENFYWMNGSGNWEDPAHWSTDQYTFESNGKIPGENDIAIILENGNDQTIQVNENTILGNLYWEAGKIHSFDGASLTVSGEIYASEAVINQFNDQAIVKGSGSLKSYSFTGDLNPNEEKLSAQTPNNNKSTDKGPGYETKAAPTFIAVNSTNASCFNTNDGIIEISVDDADQYSIDNGASWQASNQFFGLSASSYTVLARKGVDETPWAGNPVEITAPAQLQYDGADIKNVTCNGGSDGEITIYVSGGTPPYTYSDGGTLVQTGDNHFTGLSFGAYTFQITDDNGCPTGLVETDKLIVDEAPVFGFSDVIVSDILCGGAGDGSIEITINGGEPPFTYRIEGVSSGDVSTFTTTNTTHIFENLDGEKYDVYATDDYGCEIYYGQPTLDEPAQLVINSVDLTDVTGCAGNANGEIQINSTGGSGDILYSIDNETNYFLNGGDFTGLTAGTYNIWVKDENDCKINYGEVTLTEPDSVKITDISITDVTCNGDSDGSITITASGGTGNFEFSSDGGTTWTGITANPHTFNGLSAGGYDVLVRDGNSCLSLDSTVTVNEPTEVTHSVVITDATCNGDSNGAIEVTAAGGDGSYEFTNDGGATWTGITANPHTFSGLIAGDYDIQVRDATGCTSVQTTETVGQPATVTHSVSITDATCNGVADGTIEVTAAGGNGSFEFTNDGGATWTGITGNPHTFTGLAGGNYDIQVRDANGCASVISTETVGEPIAVTYSVVITDVTCFEGSDGAIVVTAAGGDGNFEFSINGGAWTGITPNPHTFSGLTAGDYDIQVRDGNGCTSTVSTETVSEPTAVTHSVVITDVSCNGNSDGSIEVTAAGGDGSYEFSIDGGPWTGIIANPHTFSGLTAGDYDIQVRDATGCTSTVSTETINEPAPVTHSVVITDATCNGDANGAIEVTAAGGDGSYEFTNDGGATWTGITANPHTFSGLIAGDYDIQVRDATGCTSVQTTETVGQPATVTHSVSITDATCNGVADGTIEVTAAGGNGSFEFTNDGGATWTGITSNPHTFTGLVGANYDIQVRDVNGCASVISTETVGEPIAVTHSVVITDVTCNSDADGTIEVTAAGGNGIYEFSINGGAWTGITPNPHTFSGLTAGDYDIQVRDGNGCTSTVSTETVNEPTAVTHSVVITDVSCNGNSDGSIEVTAAGGDGSYEFSIDGGPWTGIIANPHTFSGLTAGDYDIQVRDATGCTSTVSTETINEPAPVTHSVVITDATCNGDANGAIEVTAAGGDGSYEFTNDGGATWTGITANPHTFSGLIAGDYDIQVRDATGCTSVQTTETVGQPATVTHSVSITDATCNGVADGTIEVTAAGGNGSFEFTNDGGATWTGITANPHTFTGLAAGNYDIQVRDGNGCISVNSTESVGEPLAVTFNVGITDVTCFGGSDGAIQVTPAGGSGLYSYSNDGGATWTGFQPNPYTFAGLTAGNYDILVEDSNGCQSVVSTETLDEPTEVTHSVAITNATCNGDANGAIEVTAAGGDGSYEFSIDGGPWTGIIANPHTFSGLTAGDYDIQVRDATGCVSVLTTETVGEPAPVTHSVVITDALCSGDANGTIEVTAAGGNGSFEFSIDGGPWTGITANPHTFSGLTAGDYDIQVRDGNGCTSTVSTETINEPAPVTHSVVITDATCSGDANGTIEVTAAGGNGSFEFSIDGGSWTGITANPHTFAGLLAGNYDIQVRDGNGCTSVISTETVGEPIAVTHSVVITDVTCFNGSDGVIEVTAAGGDGNFEFSINGGSWTGITANPHTFAGLTAGDYDIQVRDGNGCTSLISTESVTEPTEVTHTSAITDVTCNGGSDGAIEVTAAGGDGSYEFSIDGGPWTGIAANPHTFGGLTAGDYDILVRDGAGCESTLTTETITEPAPISVTLIDSLLSCGSLPVFEGDTLALPDGSGVSYTSTLTFTDFDPGQTMNAGDIDNIYIDIEHSYVKDLTIELIAPDNSVILIDQQGGGKNLGYPIFNNNPNDAGDGYVYSFDDNASKTWTDVLQEAHFYDGIVNGDSAYIPSGVYVPINSINNLAGTQLNGDWTLKVTDNVQFDNGFIFKWGIRFNEQAYPANYCNGMLEVAATGGNGGFTYEWSTGATGAQITDLCADGYTVTVTDAAGCSVEYTDSVYDVDIEMIVTDTTHVLCAGDLTGSATVAATGGNAPYSFAWENGATGSTASGLAAGWYTITVTDFNSCEYVDSVEIKTIYDLDITFSDTIPITCSPENIGDSTGGVTVIVSGGTAPFTYNWSSTDGDTNVATNLVAGWNYVTVSDLNCSVIDSIYMDAPNAIQINEIAHQDVLCFGDSTGSISITVDNGEAPLLVEWSHTTDIDLYNLTDLAAGDYTVTVTDNWACMEDTTISILQPADSITFDIVVTNSSCSVDDGEATATVSGGTGPYLVTWYDETLADIGNGLTISGLGVGDYFVGVEDANLCTTSLKPFSIEHDTDLEITGIAEVSPVSCNGGCDGEYVVEFAGGVGPYNFTWSNGQMNDTATNLCGDSTYTITIIDSEGCMVSFDTVIPNPTLLTVDITDSTNVLCLGSNTGTATAAGNGGTPDYTFIWTDTDGDTVALTSVATGLYADTTYTVEVTDARGCQATTSVTLTQPATAVTATIDVTNTDCDVDNGTATINAIGGTPFTTGEPYEYLWESGAATATITDLGVGSYPFTVYDSLGCEYLDTAYIISNSDLAIALDDVQGTTCFDACDGSASITVTGGSGDFTYEWPGGIFMEDPVDTLCGGTNTVIVTDNVTGCQISLDVDVPQPLQLVVDEVVTTPALCVGSNTGTAAIVASGGTPFGGTSPYTYLWEDGATDSLRNDLAAGPYTITVFDANMCEATFDFVIGEPNPFSYDLDIQSADCGIANGSLTVSNILGGDGNYTVTWSHPDWTVDSVGLSITNLNSGNYTMVITDGNLCDTTEVINLPDNSDLVVSLVDKVDPTCNDACDGSATIEITGGTEPYTITWNNGATDVYSVNDLCDGVFTVTVVDFNNCSFEYIDSVQAPAAIVINDFVYTDPIQCAGDSIAELYVAADGGTGELSYLWGDTTGTVVSADSILTNAIAGNLYFVTITDANMCALIDSVDIPAMPDSILLAFNTGVTNCPEDSTGWAAVDVTGGVGPYSYNWYKADDIAFPIVGNDTDSASSLAFGYYVVEVTDMLGCTVVDSVIIQSNTTLDFDVEVLQEVTCEGNGSARVIDIVDGVGPFEYLWSNGETNDTAFALSVGTNSVMLTDLNSSCSVIREFEMIDDSVFDVIVFELRPDYITGPSGNGLIRLEATGGLEPYTYEWADEDGPIVDNDSLLPFLDAGWYYYTVTDALGCTISDSAEIIETSIYIQDTLITNVSCFGYDNGAITIVPAGGVPPYTTYWNDGTWSVDSVGNTITNLTAGTYYLTITDLFSSYVDSLVVTEPQPYVYNTDITAASCAGADGEIIIEVVSGGTEPFTFTWEYNGYPELDPEGLAWAWPNDTTVVNDTIMDLHVGYYYFTLVDGGGCTTFDSVYLPDNSDFDIDPIDLDPTCLIPGSISLRPHDSAAPISYTWSHDAGLNSDVATGLTGGYYAVTLVDNDLCVRNGEWTLTDPEEVDFDYEITQPACSYDTTGTVTITPIQGNGEYQYAVYPVGGSIDFQSSPVFTNLGTGQYTIRVMDISDCIEDKPALIESETSEILIAEVNDMPGCPADTDGVVGIEVSEGLPFIPFTSLSYEWTIDSATLAAWGAGEEMYDSIISTDAEVLNVRPGVYNVKVITGTGCFEEQDITLLSDTSFVFDDISVNLVDTSIYGPFANKKVIDVCKYDATSLYAAPYALKADPYEIIDPDTVYWRQGSGLVGYGMSAGNIAFDTAIVNQNGTNYYVARIVSGRCYMEDSVRVNVPNYPDVVASIDPEEYSQVFEGGRTVLTVNDVTDSTFYSWTEIWEVTEETPPSPTFDISEWNNPDWTTDSTYATFMNVRGLQDSTIYNVFANTPAPYPVEDKYCITSDTVKVRVMGEFNPPSAFSPNGDGINDTWIIYGIDKNFSFSLKIYNRWGQLVFESSNANEMLNEGWDGTNMNGNDVTIGTYYYVVEYSDGTKTRKGNGPVTVIR